METDRFQLEKAAHELNLPIAQIVIYTPIGNPQEYLPISEIINAFIEDNTPWPDIYSEITTNPEFHLNIDVDDLIFIYYSGQSDRINNILGADERFKNLDDLDLYYNDFLERMDRLKRQDDIRYQKSYQLADQLNSVNPLPTTPVEIDMITLEFKPTWKETGLPVLFEEALVLFNSTRLTDFVSYIQFNEYFKVIKPEDPVLDTPDQLVFFVWNGEGVKPDNPTKESITTGLYNLKTGILSFRTPIVQSNQKEVMISRISAAFPLLTLGPDRETRIGGIFTISNLDLQVPSLLHMILLEPLMNQYVYVEESLVSYADKKRLTLHYRSLIDTPAEESGKSYISNPSSVEISIKQIPGAIIPTVEAKISKGESREIVNQFINIFSRLMAVYMANKDPIIQYYQQYIPSETIEIESKVITPRRALSARKGTLLEELKAEAGEIFVANYARKCQAPQHPKIMTEDETAAWEAKTFTLNGQTYHRQAMRYPPDNQIKSGAPVHYFGCPSDTHPFPGVIAGNSDMPNYSTYPYLPCCFKTDQMDPSVNSLYNVYFKGQVRAQRSKVSHLIKTDKILTLGRSGTLPLVVQRLLSLAGGLPEAYVRVGVPHDPNSFLHVVGTALQDPEYIAHPKERVLQYRSHLLATQYPGLYKQQLYDATDETIAEMIADPEVFFDPQLFYRGVEEMFGINVFTFTVPPGKDSSDESVTLEIPRYASFNIRYLRLDRPTIIVFKHWGSESAGSDYPQCELIVVDTGKIFGPNMTNLLFSAELHLSRFLETSISQGQVITKENFYSRVNVVDDFIRAGWIPTAQLIDPYGKCRGVVINGVTLEIIPSMPLNLPILDFPTPNRMTTQFAIQLFGYVSPDDWYPVLDEPKGIYAPISTSLTPFPVPEPSSLKEDRSDDLWIQVLYWLWMINKSQKRPFNPLQFAKKFLILSHNPNYDWETIDPIFPKVGTVEDAIATLDPSIARNGRLIVTRAVANQVPAKLAEWYPAPVPLTLNGYYQSVPDFTSQPGVTILIGLRDYKNWVRAQQSRETKPFSVKTKLEVGTGFLSEEPYFFTPSPDQLYLIQNVLTGSLNRALQVAKTWKESKINLGFPVPEPESIDEPYVINIISMTGMPIPTADHTNGASDYLQILHYGGIYYAAMLPILT